MAWNFTGKSVLVVGGTSGINREVAMAFAEQGAKVAVISRSQEKVDDTVASLAQAGALAAEGATADVREFDNLKDAIDRLAKNFAPWDVVISGAAGNFPARALDMSSNGFKAVVDIDLVGTFHVMRAVHEHLLRPGASIVNISAPQAVVPVVGQVHVAAAKAGVDMITKSLAVEWGPEGIRVNGVMPGPIGDTEGMRRLAPTPELQKASRQSVPLRRLGSARDIAHACLFLASPMASYINGAILPVDGGWVLGGFAAIGNKLESLLGQSSSDK